MIEAPAGECHQGVVLPPSKYESQSSGIRALYTHHKKTLTLPQDNSQKEGAIIILIDHHQR